jgi:uncharacterized membrane protein
VGVAAPRAASFAAFPSPAPARSRLAAVDLLRGLVMVIMTLDHVRDFFTNARFEPTDLTHTTTALFLTRWITHYCAPVFVFLAGASAYLAGTRRRSTGELSRFLVTRGLWLVVLELTVVRVAWFFDFDFSRFALQVIWAIGMSMVALAGLVFLPIAAITAFGVGMIATHNLLDGIPAERFGSLAWLWYLLHESHLPVIYPLIPWIGVMAAGYGFGALLVRDETQRRRLLWTLGLGATLGFVGLRALNRYGDPSPWSPQASATFTVLSFLDTTKYPPSLLFLLMTLGPAITLLPLLERARGPVARFFIVFGRVPLFYYVLHLYLIHALAVVVALLAQGDARALFTIFAAFPADFGFGLPVVYLVWVVVVAALYLPSRWFAGVKQRRRDVWLSYL